MSARNDRKNPSNCPPWRIFVGIGRKNSIRPSFWTYGALYLKRETGVRIAIVNLRETSCVNSQCKTADDKTKKRQEMNRNDPCKAGLGPRLLLR